jgi:hypothetical protein
MDLPMGREGENSEQSSAGFAAALACPDSAPANAGRPASLRHGEHTKRDASTVRSVVARIFQGVAWLVLAGLVVQFYLAGAALFGVTTFQPHRTLGVALALAILLLLVLALGAQPGRRVVGLTALLAALTVVQVLLPSLRTVLPALAALHVINAAVLLAVAGAMARAPVRIAPARRSPEGLAPVGARTQG